MLAAGGRTPEERIAFLFEPVEQDDRVKGYQVEKGQYVLVGEVGLQWNNLPDYKNDPTAVRYGRNFIFGPGPSPAYGVPIPNGVNAGGQIHSILVDGSGNVAQSAAVANDGTKAFLFVCNRKCPGQVSGFSR